MCQVNFEIQTENDMEPILSGEGRYRRIGDQTWIDFTINISDPMTPDITTIGDYELEVRVSFSTTPTELEWSAWRASTFEVSAEDCNRTYYYTRENQVIGAL